MGWTWYVYNFVFWAAITKAVGQVGTAEEQGMCYGIYYAASGIISAILKCSMFTGKPFIR